MLRESISNNMTAYTVTDPAIAAPDRRLPGDLAMWFFIMAELTVFAILFIAFAVTRQLHPEMFISGQATLHPIAGVINTLALIASSYMVVLGVNAITTAQHIKARNALLAALAMACIYVVTKSWEYHTLLEQDFGITTNTFYMLYFFITFFHFMHVLLGMIILGAIALKTHRKGYHHGQQSNISGFEAGASYWHMVDLVWIILFPLINIVQ